MIAATRGGDGWLWYAMGAVVALFGGPQRFRAILAAVIAVGLGILLFLQVEAGLRAQAALRHGAALLGHAAAAGSIFFPLRPYHHGFLR